MSIFKKIRWWFEIKYCVIYAEIMARRDGYKNFDEMVRDLESMPDPGTPEEYERIWNNVVAQLKAEGIWEEEDEDQNSQGRSE